MTEFTKYPKIARLRRDIIITEKLDGTNAQILVEDDGVTVRAGSRNRWLTPGSDNFGFAAWAAAHVEQLRCLGPGRHFGEWWGLGIQRGYGLHERRFSLFNTGRWNADTPPPACVHVVPVLYSGPFSDGAVISAMNRLRAAGSAAAPGFNSPEGIVVFHTASGGLFKVTLEGDDMPKSQAARLAAGHFEIINRKDVTNGKPTPRNQWLP